jgi:hypothetical protein
MKKEVKGQRKRVRNEEKKVGRKEENKNEVVTKLKKK